MVYVTLSLLQLLFKLENTSKFRREKKSRGFCLGGEKFWKAIEMGSWTSLRDIVYV